MFDNKFKHKILFLNGANLNMLGLREPTIYGENSILNIEKDLIKISNEENVFLDFYQTNSEEKLINKIHQALNEYDFIVINPAAWTHTSIALRDALLCVNIPFIEIHLSNIYKRESFRQNSFFSDIAIGVISGLGFLSYRYALFYAIDYIKKDCSNK